MRHAVTAFFVGALLILAPSLGAADVTLTSGVTVGPGQSAYIPVSLTDAAPVGGVFVSLSSSDTSKVTVNPQNVYVPAGLKTPFAQPQVTGVSFGQAEISASAYGLTGSSQTVRVAGTLVGPSSETIQRGNTLNVTFAVSSPAPGAITLAVSSDNPAVASVPGSVVIPANGTSVVVPVTGLSAGSTIIHVGAPPSLAEHTVNISVVAPGTITLSNSVSVGLGQSAAFPVTLGTAAPAGGVVITLSSSAPSTVMVSPSSVFVPAGFTTPFAQPQVTGNNIGAATITASAPGYAPASLQVPVTATITMSPTNMILASGGTQLLSLALSASAPWDTGITVLLSSSNPAVATLQPSVQFYPDGSAFTTVVVVVTGVAPGTTVIHASAPPFIPDTVSTVTVTPSGAGPSVISATGGTPQTATVNTPFGNRLAATVRDANGNPVSGLIVTFSAPSSGPSVTFPGGVNTAVTDASGVATSPTITANGITGTFNVTASVTGVPGVALFALTNSSSASGSIVLPSSVTIGPNQSVSFPVTLTTPAPPGGVVVNLTSSDPTKATVAPSSLLFAAGSVTPSAQPLLTGVNFGSSTINASAVGYTSASQPVQIGATLSFSPSALTTNGLGARTLSLNISSPAPLGGLALSLSSSNTNVATVPSSAFFAANTTSVSVVITGVAIGSAVITANAGVPNVPNATVNVSVTVPATDITLGSGVTVGPGQSAYIPVSLSNAAPVGGVFVSLSSSDTSKVTVSPQNAYVPAGLKTPFAQPQVTGVSFGQAEISASAYGLTGSSQTVRVAGTLVGPSSETIQRGNTLNVTFAVSSPAPGAITLAVSSDNPAVASVPGSVVIPANGTSVVVPVTGLSAGSTIIHVGAPPSLAEHTVNISVVAPGTITLSNSVSVGLGQSAAFPVTLGTAAPAGGVVITLSSSAPSTVTVSPSSVFVPAGFTTPFAQPQVTGNNIGAATITASAPGYAPASLQVPVTATITMSPTNMILASGGTQLLSLALSASAPWDTGITVLLSSSNPAVATLQPSVQFYPDGSAFTTVVVVVTGVAPGTTVIHASAPPFIPDTTVTITVVTGMGAAKL